MVRLDFPSLEWLHDNHKIGKDKLQCICNLSIDMGFRESRFSFQRKQIQALHKGLSARLVSEFLFDYNQPVCRFDLEQFLEAL